MNDSPDRAERRELLDFAVTLARLAGDHTLQYFGGVVDHDAKGDGSPVTIADREAERLIRAEVTKRYPEHAVLGEEFGESNPGARVRWILDPIDATRSFMRGVPLYGVLIGIEINGDTVVGVANYPPLSELVAAASGLGCTLNGSPVTVSPVHTLDQAVVLTTDVERILSMPEGPGWRSLQQRCAFSRTWGDCYGHLLVATGRAEVMVDPIMNPWDAAPFLPIMTEAGGRFTTREGVTTIHGGSGISTNGLLHDEVLAALRTE